LYQDNDGTIFLI